MKKKISHFIVLLILCVIVLSFLLGACLPKFDTAKKDGDLLKLKSLTIKNSSFKIMQINDMHLISPGKNKADSQSLRWLEEALDRELPDLVEVTGDTVGSNVKGRNPALLAVANIFEKRKIYWAYTFGNHDGEHSLKNGKDFWIGKEGQSTSLRESNENVNKFFHSDEFDIFYGDNTTGNKELFELLKGYEYALITRSEEELKDDNEKFMGVGNYIIELKDQSNNVKFAIFHMDTHGKFYIKEKNETNPKKYIDAGYVGLTDMQVNWYEEKIAYYSNNNIHSALFMHVPAYAYRMLYEEVDGFDEYGIPKFKEKKMLENGVLPSSTVALYEPYLPTKYENIAFVKDEGIYGPKWDDGLFDVINKYPSTILMSTGHDHDNSFVTMVNLENTKLLVGYGRTSGVNAWGRNIPIGASVFTLNFNENDVEEMIDVKIIWPTFKYIKKGPR